MTEPVAPSPSPPASTTPLWRRLLPWVVAVGTLAWLFATVPLGELRAVLARAPLGALLALVVVYIALVLLADTFATWATFRSALPEAALTFGETLNVRGASYLLAIIHYGAGQGGIAYFVSRRHGVPLARAAGAVMLIMGVNVIVVALFALCGVAVGGAPSTPAQRLLVFGLACGFPVYLGIIALRPGFLARRRLLAPLFHAGLRGHGIATLARLPHILVLILGQYAAMQLFDIHPPFPTALALLPVVFVIAVLPISASGIGTAQAAMVALFSPFAPGATADARQASVLACSLALQLLGLIVQALVGLVFVRRLTVSSKREASSSERP